MGYAMPVSGDMAGYQTASPRKSAQSVSRGDEMLMARSQPTCEPGFTPERVVVTVSESSKLTAERIMP